MNYTIEEIYLLVGKDDKTAGLTFKYGSDAFKKYGSFKYLDISIKLSKKAGMNFV